MSFCGSIFRPAAIGAALLVVYGQWMAAGCYGLSGAAVGAQAAGGTVQAKLDALDCSDTNLSKAQTLAGADPQIGKNLNDALSSLFKVKASWPDGAHGRNFLTPAPCPAATSLSGALTNAGTELGAAHKIAQQQKSLRAVTKDLNDAIAAVKAASDAAKKTAPPAPGAGANGEVVTVPAATASGTPETEAPQPDSIQPPDSIPPPSADCLFLYDVKSAAEFLKQAEATPGLPDAASQPIGRARAVLDPLVSNSGCIDGVQFYGPTKDADVSSLLASAARYVDQARSKKGAAQGGATAQIGQDLAGVANDIKTAQANLPKGPSGQASEKAKTPDLVLLCAAGLVFLLALCVAFWSSSQVSRMRSRARLDRNRLKQLNSEYEETYRAFGSLKLQLNELKKKLEQQEAAVKQFDERAREDAANAAEEEAGGTGDIESAAIAFSTQQRLDDPASVKASAETDRSGSDAKPAPEPEPEVRDRVTDYNKARGMKSSERVERFREWYPTQSILEWINPAVRASKDPSEIRLKDDPFGNLLAVVEGQKAFIFPNFTYNYETGRNSLEGVFMYPPDGVASSTVVEAAVAEKDGDGWRLKTRGQFGG